MTLMMFIMIWVAVGILSSVWSIWNDWYRGINISLGMLIGYALMAIVGGGLWTVILIGMVIEEHSRNVVIRGRNKP